MSHTLNNCKHPKFHYVLPIIRELFSFLDPHAELRNENTLRQHSRKSIVKIEEHLSPDDLICKFWQPEKSNEDL